ncbi:4-alpha-glucanotransferase [Streptomyces sp. NPDC059740]|uniref:4-alpha-glucanotransferase n=1 Tax=Streptomyces sp. NPDC059740 TaxID=3346926 RepID=UPI003653591D
MMDERRAGVLLHPSSLPGPYGTGEFGPAAVEWLEFLAGAEQTVWQMLPLHPVGESGCPYQTFSVLAGNPLFVSVDWLREAGLVDRGDLAGLPRCPPDRVSYPTAARIKEQLLTRAHANFTHTADSLAFCEEQAWWLEDYARHTVLRRRHGPDRGGWPPSLARREADAVARFDAEAASELSQVRFEQYVYARHFAAVRRRAAELGVRLLGDLSMFPAVDSAEVWTRPELFQLDPDGSPTAVAGFPPDEFSGEGQVWGNALYRWKALAEERYAWWADRVGLAARQFDAVRLDHFRGFHRYWAVPVPGRAADGHWEEGPGTGLFDALRERIGDFPLVAEDLGPASPEVQRLRAAAGIPGMRLLQFAFSGDENQHLPHHHTPDCVAYTGTHDNDTTAGWWAGASAGERERAERYLGHVGDDICGAAMRAVHGSPARLAVLPLQDVLRLDSSARLNLPGRAEDNWTWRYDRRSLTPGLEFRLRQLTETYGRDRRAARRRARGFSA